MGIHFKLDQESFDRLREPWEELCRREMKAFEFAYQTSIEIREVVDGVAEGRPQPVYTKVPNATAYSAGSQNNSSFKIVLTPDDLFVHTQGVKGRKIDYAALRMIFDKWLGHFQDFSEENAALLGVHLHYHNLITKQRFPEFYQSASALKLNEVTRHLSQFPKFSHLGYAPPRSEVDFKCADGYGAKLDLGSAIQASGRREHGVAIDLSAHGRSLTGEIAMVSDQLDQCRSIIHDLFEDTFEETAKKVFKPRPCR